MTITQIMLFALISVIILTVLRKYVSQLSLVAEIAVIIIVIISVIPEFKGLVNTFSNITDMTSVSDDILKTMLKATRLLQAKALQHLVL